ncbi:MAG TPA: anthranilate phosphoribosyltransferase, partial [Micromonosporaceae bacterium]
ADLGVPRSVASDLRGADAAFNSGVARRLLAGESGPVRDAVVVNAATALAAHASRQDPRGLADDESLASAIRNAMARAVESIDSGRAAIVLDRWTAAAQQFKASAAG